MTPVSSFHTMKMKKTYFSFNFIIQELLFELGQGIVCAVIVEVQGVQYVPEGKKADHALEHISKNSSNSVQEVAFF